MSGCLGCTACCELVGIDHPKYGSIPTFTRCPDLRARGCSIQHSKPSGCVEYRCAWLISQDGDDPWPLDMRPDRSGVVTNRASDEYLRVFAAGEVAPAALAWLERRAARIEMVRAS